MIILYLSGDGETKADHFILMSTVFNIKKSDLKLAISFIYA